MKSTSQTESGGHLLLIACSATKRPVRAPAIQLYDGVNYRVIRKMLSESGWPPGLVIKILSAKYGLIDPTTIIDPYEQRMDEATALRLRNSVTNKLTKLNAFESVFVNLGADYLAAVADLRSIFPEAICAQGGIGMKMNAMKRWLQRLPKHTAPFPRQKAKKQSYLYFFPDWDDFVYEPFVAEQGREHRLSGAVRKRYAHEVFGNSTPYDGLLVSLAQLAAGKGALSRLAKGEVKPRDLRKQMRVPSRLLMFGDCGAFSYVNDPVPPFTPEEAAEAYERFGFDAGASVDHIPFPEIVEQRPDGSVRKRILSGRELKARLQLTVSNAERFLQVHRTRGYSFSPVGVVQGMSVLSYVDCVHKYLDMGYRHIALGGLVPRSDADILEICCATRNAIQRRTRGERQNVWIHLFGILRPKLQSAFRALGVSSFDSASYLRKAWLRSDQNYLSPDGTKWYSTIRVPISSSAPMLDGATRASLTQVELAERERRCLNALDQFDGSPITTREVLDSVNEYGPLLQRKGEDNHFIEKHAALLRDRPWESCRCPFCRSAGINVVVFRGASRNKRRGLHNTWVFYHKVLYGKRIPKQALEE
ncbi:MAG: tRNA-guanine transglycosylase DpdA [Phycisphaerae bacterium]|nr:tRNA-guanine transglycosylase DpdA [Phycisphaerae bacterium]